VGSMKRVNPLSRSLVFGERFLLIMIRMLKTADCMMQMIDKIGTKVLRNNVEIIKVTVLLLENDDHEVLSTAISLLLAILSGKKYHLDIMPC
jgi:hypothetical protein